MATTKRGFFEVASLTATLHAKHLFRYDAEPLSAAASRSHIYWVTEASHPSIVEASNNGSHRHVIVSKIGEGGDALLIAGRYLYWNGDHGVGRVRLDGRHVQRQFIELPQAGGGDDVADGMTTDGRYLYFNQCIKGRIGRVPLAVNSRHSHVDWVATGVDCAFDVTYANGYLFYSVDQYIGRIRTDGSQRNDHWRLSRSPGGGAGDLVADKQRIYWDYCYEAQCAVSHIADMTTAGHHLKRGQLNNIDQGLTLAP